MTVVVHRCLEKDPEQRFQSARDLAFALRGTLRERAASRSAPRTFAIARIAPAAALAAGAFWFALVRDSAPGDASARAAVRETAVPARAALITKTHALPAATDAYIRGRHALEKRTEADLHTAIRFFQESIDTDPTYAAAYAGLAHSYAQLGYGSFLAPADAFPRARAAADRALEIDPALPDAHAALGYELMYYDWDFRRAEAEFTRAIALDPSSALTHQWYAYLLTATDRPFEDADHEISAAERLDPLSVPINIDRAYILHYYGRNDAALRAIERALEMNPSYPPGFFWLARIYTAEGRYQDATAALEHIDALASWTPAMAVRGFLAAKAGRPAEARAVLAQFDALARQGRYASAYAVAVVHAGLGDREQALASLDRALGERSHWLVWLKRDPRWDELRADPRFARLVREVGLPK